MYIEYQDIDVDDQADLSALCSAVKEKNILIIGPGVSIRKEEDRIFTYIANNKPAIFAINFLASPFPIQYLFLSNAKRYLQMAAVLSKGNLPFQVVATSNVTKTNGYFDYTLKYSSLIDETAEIIDHSLLMLLKVMVKLGVRNVTLAGFDGYSGQETKNYINPDMEYCFTGIQAERLNVYTASVLDALDAQLSIEFLTDSRYQAKQKKKERQER